MAINDFKARVLRVNQIINSGSASTSPLLIYGLGSATDASGSFTASHFAGTGSDVWMFISGTQKSADSANSRGAVAFKGDIVVSGVIQVGEQSSAPSTPASGKAVLYAKTDGKPYFKNDSGTEYDLTAATPDGADTEVQFNDGGSAFGSDPAFTFDKISNTLTVTNSTVTNIASASSMLATTVTAQTASVKVIESKLSPDDTIIFMKGGGGFAVPDYGSDVVILVSGSRNTGSRSVFNTRMVVSGNFSLYNTSSDVELVLLRATDGLISGANDIIANRNIYVNGGNFQTTATTFNLLPDSNITTINFGDQTETLNIGSFTSTSSFRGDVSAYTADLIRNLNVTGSINGGSTGNFRINSAGNTFISSSINTTITGSGFFIASGSDLILDTSSGLFYMKKLGTTFLEVTAQNTSNPVIRSSQNNSTLLVSGTSVTVQADNVVRLKTMGQDLITFSSSSDDGFKSALIDSENVNSLYMRSKDGYVVISGSLGNRILTSTQVTGSVAASLGFTGSLTKLSDGSNYLIPGSNITLVTGSNGSVTISSTGGGGGSVAGSNTQVQFNDNGAFSAKSTFTFATGSDRLSVTHISASTITASYISPGSPLVIRPQGNPAEAGSDTFFYVTGSESSEFAVFGGRLVTSGSIRVKNSSANDVAVINTSGVISGSGNLQTGGSFTVAGDIIADRNSPRNLLTDVVSITFGGAASTITIPGDVAVNGGDITTTSTTANIFNANATTVNIAGDATAVNIGKSNGTVTVPGNLTVNGTTTTINTTNLLVRDPFIIMSSGSAGPNAQGGIVIFSGSSDVVQTDLVWGRVANDTWGAVKIASNNGNITNLGGSTLVPVRASAFQVNGANDTIELDANNLFISSSVAKGVRLQHGAGANGKVTFRQDTDDYLTFTSGSLGAAITPNASLISTSGGKGISLGTNAPTVISGTSVYLQAGTAGVLFQRNGSTFVSIDSPSSTQANFTAAAGISTANVLQTATTINVGGSTTTSSFSGAAELGLVIEKLNTSGSSSGTTTFNLQSQNIFFQKSPLGNITANFINVPSTIDRVITPTIIVSQSSPAYIVSDIRIEGSSVTVNWPNAILPTGTANRYDVFGFSLIRSGSTWLALGQMTSYGS